MEDQSADFNSFLNQGEKGSDCVVFQFGSHSVKFGLASQLQPFVVPNCIAYRYNDDSDKMDVEIEIKNNNLNNEGRDEKSDLFLSDLLNVEQEIIGKLVKLEQKEKGKNKLANQNKTYSANKVYDSSNCEADHQERKNFEQNPNSTASYKKALGMAYDINEDIPDNYYKWTSTANKPSYLVGREALTIAETEQYQLRYPIRYGFFNNNITYQGVLDDLRNITDFCLVQVLQIPRKEFSNYNVVIIIPDLFIKQQVKGLVNIFLRVLNFKGVFIHLESIMSSFGAALQSSCIIDIGSSKVNVVCVDEGLIIEESLIRKNFGGDDITKLLYHMLTRKNSKNYFPSHYFNPDNSYHFRIFEKLKENECELPNLQNPSSQFVQKNCKIWLHRKNENTKSFNVTISDSLYISPLGLFYPQVFETIRNAHLPYLNEYNDIYDEIFTDPEDIMMDMIKILITNQQNENKKDEPLSNLNSTIKKAEKFNNNASELNEDSVSVVGSRIDKSINNCFKEETSKNKGFNVLVYKNTYENMYQSIGIEEMVCQSIMSVNNPELRKKLANAILLVGGSSKFKGLVDYLEDILIDKLTTCDNEIDRIEIINFPSVDAKTITWIGGTIIPKLDSAKDMWITRDRWLGEIEKGEENIKEKIVQPQVNSESTEAKADAALKEKVKKKDRHLDGGPRTIREKSAFQW